MSTTLVLLAMSGVAQAVDLCANLDRVMDQSRVEFADILDNSKDDTGDQNVTVALADGADCTVTQISNQSAYQCRWSFPHRADAAYDAFDRFVESLDDCIGENATLHRDQSVNHPDFYDLRRYETARADVSVSVKDKSALQSTFVVIRVHSRPVD